MSLAACAALVERADPIRFRATMAAPVAARRVLFPLYAFNVEVSRAPWVTAEAMIAEMRLQWWRDALQEIAAGDGARRHDVVDALADVLDVEAAQCLDGLVAARRWDIYTDAFEDAAHLDEYVDATAGHLIWTAARLLGPAAQSPVRDFAYGVGVANLLRAVPELEARGHKPLVDGTAAGVQALARKALARRGAAVKSRRDISGAAGAALIAGWQAKPVLAKAAAQPKAAAAGTLAPSALADTARLLTVSTLGWWR